jgi:hypothetical protein
VGNFSFDPKDGQWETMGSLKAFNIFDYTTKSGYRIGQLEKPFDAFLSLRGLSFNQRLKI